MKKSEARRDMADMNDFYADLMSGHSRAGKRSSSGLFRRFKSRNAPKSRTNPAPLRIKSDEFVPPVARQKINLDQSGLKQQKKKAPAKKVLSRIDWSGPRVRPWLKLLFVLGSVFATALLIWLGLELFGGKAGNNGDPGDITPASVYVPKGLPEGFSVGSGSQNLENGAVLYTVYSDKGNEITVTQQARPEGFDDGFLSNAQAFDTPLGKGYILESEERTTGYVLTDETMLLFNTVSDIETADLRELMAAFRP